MERSEKQIEFTKAFINYIKNSKHRTLFPLYGVVHYSESSVC